VATAAESPLVGQQREHILDGQIDDAAAVDRHPRRITLGEEADRSRAQIDVVGGLEVLT
jgi:hypothetical protein